MAVATRADLIRQLNEANEAYAQRYTELHDGLSQAKSDNVALKREIEVLRKGNDELRERALSDRCENARLAGKLEMLRELGAIPTIENVEIAPINVFNDGRDINGHVRDSAIYSRGR